VYHKYRSILSTNNKAKIMIKPGYRTSEFWFTAVSFIFSGLYLLGIINDNSHKEELIGNVSHAVESCILIGGQLVILYKYINSRKEIKKTWWDTADRTERERANSINDGRNKDVNNKRTSKPRSRKTSKSSKKIPK
jgi:hypothetical protein